MQKLIISLLLFFYSVTYVSAADVPFELPIRNDILKLQTAIIYTEKGKIKLQLYPNEAPWHISNLKYLADKNFYKNTRFHIHRPGYIIQGGDPSGSGLGGPKYSLPPEFSQHRHVRGTFGMARLDNPNNPERRSHGSQFHIILGDSPHMNAQYTVLGRVIEGMSVIDRLEVGDTLINLKVFVRPSKK